MILLIDNYDSFSYNLYQLVGVINSDIKVIRNDELTISQIEQLKPSHIILSPGPGRPKDAGICEDVIGHFAGRIPILGVCLGHQAICEVFGATVSYAKELMHGKKSLIHIANGSELFKGLPPIIDGARYHSLSMVRDSLPDELLIIAEDSSGEVMGVKHREADVYGVQFHPESILTPKGRTILENFLNIGCQANCEYRR
ncbi:MAG TPA: aminodeoxychorismate/anthranilate synthase component II [Ruminiclostridium sp.]|nr:aminodeoxychorismate/anthranilate synthase component II [Ruminiclostridium sp.]